MGNSATGGNSAAWGVATATSPGMLSATAQDIAGVKSFVDGVQGPGTVPIGCMLASMPNIDAVNAWQPPASGVIKDGFMRADGTIIDAGHVALGCLLALGTTLPSMMQRYPRGGTTSGATGGSNTFTPAGTNAASTVPASGLAFSGSSTSYSVSVPAHYHSNGTGSTAATSVGVTGGTASGTFASSSHSHDQGSLRAAIGASNGDIGALSYVASWVHGNAATTTAYTVFGASSTSASRSFNHHTPVNGDTGGNSASASLSSTAASMTGSNTVTGTFGLVTGGQNGNAAISASGSNTPAGSITGTATATAQVFTGTTSNSEPAYVETIWVIRVK